MTAWYIIAIGIALVTGGLLGVFVMCLCKAGSRGEDCKECRYKQDYDRRMALAQKNVVFMSDYAKGRVEKMGQ